MDCDTRRPELELGETAPERAPGTPRRRARSAAARPFDMWLEKQLQSMYEIEQQSPVRLPNEAGGR
jgi:hypothetical protein